MKYENPEIPEGINVDREHPLKEFAALIGGVLAVVLCIVLLLGWFAEYFAVRIPFAYEQQIIGKLGRTASPDPAHAAVESELQKLADALAAHMQLPLEMHIQVHYVDDAETVNAFATLGGHVMIFRGLLERLPSENALAMVLAHEIAHVQHRDPIVALGRGVAVGLALAAVTGVSGDNLTDGLLGNAGMLTVLSFNRAQERAADAAALAAIAARYGHVAGADTVFELFASAGEHSVHAPEFLSSHPDIDARHAGIAARAAMQGWPLRGVPRALPPALRLSRATK